MFSKVVVANRGAVAARVLRSLDRLGIRSVAVYSEADKDAPYLALAGEAHCIGPAAPKASYLNQPVILGVMRQVGADALHPGYGFLSENHRFALEVQAAGAAFIGPSPRWIEAMGHKTRARALMAEHGMPLCPSTGVLAGTGEQALAEALAIGFPVLVKPANGGGGIGMLPAHCPADLEAALERARSLAARSFGDSEVYLERLMRKPRHIEFQMLADNYGEVRHLYERDCSVQRRHQKIIEEAVAPALARSEAEATAARVEKILAAIGYDNIGTVEMLYDADAGFNFLEMNTRLQVEHAVTEEVTGLDLVAAQIRLAAGARLADVLPESIVLDGHAVEARVYAEDPRRFLPSPGPLTVFRPPTGEGIRVETGYAEGGAVTPFYDPMIAKVIARGATRDIALDRLAAALADFEVRGVKTNIPFVQAVLLDEGFRAGQVHTSLAAEVVARGEKRAAA